MRKLSPAPLGAALLCALAFGTGIAAAADPATSASKTDKRAEWRQQMFDRIDTNHDGTISRAEYQAWVDARFDKLDANGSGKVSADDIANSAVAKERVQKRADQFVKHYDTSGTGEVTKADFEAKEMARFDRMSGGTDTLTQAQFDAAGARRHGRGGPHKPDVANDGG